MVTRKATGKWGRLLVMLSALLILAGLAPAASSAAQASASGGTAATTDTSPVNLSTKVNMADGKARQSATVVAGDARFEVLAPDVIRLEYAPGGNFLDQPTYNVLDRNLPVPAYQTSQNDGWLTIKTSRMIVRYRLGSGPFTAANTQMRLQDQSVNGTTTVQPSWEWECTYGQVCQSGAASLSGGAAIAADHTGYDSPRGFIASYTQAGADASWQLLGAPSGKATVTIRYANSAGGDGKAEPRTMTLMVNGTPTQVTFPVTASWDDWSTVSVPVSLQAGTNAVAVRCASGDSCNINVDDVAVTAPGASAAPVLPSGALGGSISAFDGTNGSYSASPSCTNGESGATCQAPIPAQARGLLDKSGWYLLDDTQTAVWTSDGWVTPRPAGDVEDGYLFGYGDNYAAALEDLARLTGPAPLLPEYTFGNWFSRYYPYTTSEYENQLLPEFKANGVSLDTLSVDTNWKSPNSWDGWEWNPALFPDPSAFLTWAKQQGIHTTLNIHPTISTDDPRLAEAQGIAGNTLACSNGECSWDWSKIPQAESFFALQQQFEQQGVDFWWLDGEGSVSMHGLPATWINHLYAQELANKGKRGFVLARIGSANAAGPWAEHRSAVHFTGDTWSTWNTLAMEAELAQDEGSVGQPYVSNDIGGFLGSPSGGPNDPDDLYLRWLQLGAFQPIMREHSNGGQNARLPWEYDAATQAAGDKFMQLREKLVPYLYTLSQQASATGLPMTRALYLDYPGQPSAYDYPGEYLLGSDMLVAPVTTPGNVATTKVWFPPGRWTDWFTGATFTGPSTQTLTVPLDRMPVFVKAGGIVPLQPPDSHAQDAGSAPITLRVFAGGHGKYTMYNDAGRGLGYQQGQYTDTPINYASGAKASTVVIGPAHGSYPGEPGSKQYTVDLVDVSSPQSVQVDGKPLTASGWSYDSATHTLQVPLGTVPAGRATTVTQVGGSAVQAAEPAATQLTISPPDSISVQPGATKTISATLSNSGPGAVNGVSLGLKAPSGWTVTAATPVTASSLAAGSSLSASWQVTAPASSSDTSEAATLTATGSYTDAATGQAGTLTAQQIPTPVITSVSPSSASAGQVVTVTGTNFGSSQGSSYLKFSDAGTNWGAPGDIAPFSIDSWSANQITFTVPTPQGTPYQVVPGTTAAVTVTTPDGTSNAGTLTISSG